MTYKTPHLTIPQQSAGMLYRFPFFKQYREKAAIVWKGTLQPTQESPAYMVKVVYKNSRAPRVWVLAPEIHESAPHRYQDESLCLYWPREWIWSPNALIAETIVPWAAIWLYFYELWIKYGAWYGPEAPHVGEK